MTPGVLVPAEVLAELRSHPLVGDLSRVRPTIGGFSNLTFFADLTTGVTVVVKCASREVKRSDLRREATMLGLLAESELPHPKLRAHSATDAWTVTVMDAVEGDLGINVIQTRDLRDLVFRARTMARLLQRVHQTALAPSGDNSLDCGAQFLSAQASLKQRSLPAEIGFAVDALNDPVLQRGVSLVHGDFGFHNTIWDSLPSGNNGDNGDTRVSALLDWEWSGWGSPLIDASWLWWTLRFRQSPPETWDSFAETYGVWALRAIGWAPDTVNAVLRAQMASILARTEPGSSAELEWCSRIMRLDQLHVPTL